MKNNLEDLRNKLKNIDAASLCDANKSLRVVDPSICCRSACSSFVGKVVIASCENDFFPVIEALESSCAGDVLIIGTNNSRSAVAGELFANEAKRRGLAALVIDGAVRDTQSVAKMNIPVYSRFKTPMAGTTCSLGDTPTSLLVGDAKVKAGDIAVGDEDGIVVGTIEEIEEAIPKALEIQKAEAYIVEQIEGGRSLFDFINFREHRDALKEKQDSKLKFIL